MLKEFSINRCFIVLVILLLPVFVYSSTVFDLRCNYKINPLGLGDLQPRLSWKLKADDPDDRSVFQLAYQIQVSESRDKLQEEQSLVWDSGKVRLDQSIQVVYDGEVLQAKTKYFWRVKVWDNKSQEAIWSEVNSWEMGLIYSQNWLADWISPKLEEKEKAYNPCPLLRRTFSSKSDLAKARLYISSKGLYEAYINGNKVGDEYFTPGRTAYNKRLQYQVFDVTDMIGEGDQVAGIRLADGWFRGQFDSYDRWNENYGQKLALLFQLELTYEDGTTELVLSDDQWHCSTGAIRMSGLYDGELFDESQEKKGWKKSKYDDSNWKKVEVDKGANAKDILVASEGLPVKKMELISAKKLIRTPQGDTVIDMGQNMVGWMELTIQTKPGDVLTLLHAEVLDKDGNFYEDNLRTADQKVTYKISTDGLKTLHPNHTFHGFRYVKLSGFNGPINLNNFKGTVLYSEMPRTGYFSCSNEKINQLQSNIIWGQKGNFLDVPMDCPQRDERLGWTGDAQVFCATACFNFEAINFYTKWLQDLKLEQLENGSIPWVVPDVLHRNGSAGWGDAATIIPWTLYMLYGDKDLLTRQYDSMKAWLSYLQELAGDDLIVGKGFHFGDWNSYRHPTDWNNKPGYTDKDLIATAFFAYSTSICEKTAKVLGKEKDALQFTLLLKQIKTAFQKEFITGSGRLSSHTQTAYVLALRFGLIPEEKKDAAVEYLVANIIERKVHLSTGFLGTPHLCHVLSEHGYTDLAYELLLQESFPSWLYPINKGATTIWERWDGIKPDGSFQDVKANSFNHYAYGAIGEWMYGVITGIKADEVIPAYKRFKIEPQLSHSLKEAKASFSSPYGVIRSEWVKQTDQFTILIEVPANTSAEIILPFGKLERLLENGKDLSQVEGILLKENVGAGSRLELGSGIYHFEMKLSE